jgi:hypothetical protein
MYGGGIFEHAAIGGNHPWYAGLSNIAYAKINTHPAGRPAVQLRSAPSLTDPAALPLS